MTKVQQALIDLGHDLGPKGADGSFGPRTASAVRQFKTKQQLGFEQFGDVGPGTAKRLDELFPPAPVDPPTRKEAVEDDSSCPFNTDALTKAVAELSPAAAEPQTEALVEPVGAPGANVHLSIDDAVKKFQSQVNVVGVASGKNVTDLGQFFWSAQVSDAIASELNRMSGEPTAQQFVTKARVARNAIDGSQDARALLRELDAIAQKSKSPERGAMQTLLARDRTGGPALELSLWAAFVADDTNRLPNLTSARSLRVLESITGPEFIACWSHAMAVARKLKKKGGLQPRDAKTKPIGANLVGPAFRDRRPDPPGSTTHKGDVFNQIGVAGVASDLKKALDGGQVIHARVLSGVGYGTNPNVPAEPKGRRFQLPAPPEEHSLLIIGFDGDFFVFNDPDAGVSKTPVAGFGKLFFDGKRLSTAFGDADLPVDAHGKHQRGDKRYQIISLVTVV